MKKLSDEKVSLIKDAAHVGMNKSAIARYANVHRDTLDKWIKNDPDVSEAFYHGRGSGDYEIAKKIHEEALKGNTTLLAHLSVKRLKNSEFNNDYDDALNATEENGQVNILNGLTNDELKQRVKELTSE